MNVNVYADEKSDVYANMEEKFDIVLRDQLSQEDYSELTDTKKYHDSMKNKNIKDKPILKVYNEIYWNLANKSLAEIVETAEKNEFNCDNYVVFDEVPFNVCVFKSDKSVAVKKVYDFVPRYIKDIQNLNATSELLNKECKIEGIYCFDASSSYFGTVVYLKTNNGVFVKYYKNADADALVFTEDKFADYAVDYYEYITSDEVNYNEFGEPLYSSDMGFSSFIDKSNNIDNNNLNTIHRNDTQKSTLLICLAVAVIALAVSVVFIVRLKRLR